MSALIQDKESPINNHQSSHNNSKDHDENIHRGVQAPGANSDAPPSVNDNEKQVTDNDHEREFGSQPSTNGRSEKSPRSKSSDASEKSDLSTDAPGASHDESSPQTNCARRPSTTSRFKDKRPEPLKLNPNLNQDIPLDLSVKSAGNVPSGTLSNIFNLGPINSMGPLETPRIQWQDNDALLVTNKSRLFSTSTTASQRARVSSLIGESPPTTPVTPLMDLMFSPSGATSMRVSNDMSASLALESPLNSLLISPFELNKLQILDKLAQSNKPLVDYHHMRADLRGTPRRSCSTENLTFAMNGIRNQAIDNTFKHTVKQEDKNLTNGLTVTNKKNSISPLATKSLSNQADKTVSSPTKFPYTTNQASTTIYSDTQKSPTSSANGTALTPTSVANATANLLNIHLSSPNGGSQQSPNSSSNDVNKITQNSPQYKMPSFSTFDQDPSPLDPLISAAYCQQQLQHNARTTYTNFTLNHADQQHQQHLSHYQQHGVSTISNNATLNTPTLISPRHMKSGHLCFLHSPMSPMSSVFDLPSPFLMFPPTSSQGAQPQSASSSHDNKNSFSGPTNSKAPERTTKSDQNKSKDKDTVGESTRSEDNAKQSQCNVGQASTSKGSSLRRTCSATAPETTSNIDDLSRLITSATQKPRMHQPNDVHQNLEADMEVDEEPTHLMTGERSEDDYISEASARPATVIPQICVSDHHNSRVSNNHTKTNSNQNEVHRSSQPSLHHPEEFVESLEQREQRNLLCKRSLSPKSFRARINNYHHERHESSSAPPDVYQRRVRAKIKTVTEDSCVKLDSKGDVSKVRTSVGMKGQLHSHSQTDINQANNHQHRSSGKPYPVVRSWLTTSSQHLQNRSCYSNGISPLGTRSNSAEPAIYSNNNPTVKAQQYVSSKDVSPKENSNLYHLAGQSFPTQNTVPHQAYLPHQVNTLRAHDSSLSQHIHQPQPQPQLQQQQQQQHQQHQYQMSQNQQPRYQQEYVQSHHPDQQQQQHSKSAGDLNRLQFLRHGCAQPLQSSNLMTTSNDTLAYAQARHYQQQQQPLASSHQNIPLNGNNNHPAQSNNRQRQFVGDQNRHSSMNMAQSITRPTSHQPIKSEMLCRGFEICNQSGMHDTIRRRSTTDSLIANQLHLPNMTPLSFANSEARAPNLNYSCQLDMDSSRSDSKSSCSLDFSGSFAGSRSSSSASSNLAAKKYHCDLCSKSFTRSDMLTRHKRLHSGDRPFQCGECKQEFSRSDHLSTHMRTHTGEKPYKCKLCSYSACRKDMITRHLKVHNKNPNEFGHS